LRKIEAWSAEYDANLMYNRSSGGPMLGQKRAMARPALGILAYILVKFSPIIAYLPIFSVLARPTFW
jgi:hypothetical protein